MKPSARKPDDDIEKRAKAIYLYLLASSTKSEIARALARRERRREKKVRESAHWLGLHQGLAKRKDRAARGKGRK